MRSLLCFVSLVFAAGCFGGPTPTKDKGGPVVVITDCDGGCPDGGGSTPVCTTGALPNGCDLGSDCLENGECASGLCSGAGKCIPAACDNDAQDEGETGIDCGGDCPACFGESCSENEHCVTVYCSAGSCAEPSCTDGTKNGLETGADCGGDCAPCEVGSGCRRAADCVSGQCVDEICGEPPASCRDGEKNGEETDVDCGGPECGACAQDRTCGGHADCLTEFCQFGVCKIPTCDDGAHNGEETDEDCGGPSCPACTDGRACGAPSDCASGTCQSGSCVSCSDGVKNGSETGTDCGGSCAACDDGAACNAGTDCSSGRCDAAVCSSCFDGRKSGDEVGVDCGGSCYPCGDGQSCSSHGDCSSNRCEGGKCCYPNDCGFCGPTPTETCNGRDDDCDGSVDEGLTRPACANAKGVCAGATSRCDGSAGWVCDDAVYGTHSTDYEPAMDIPCDGLDNDCDGQTDEEACESTTTCKVGQCSNGQCIEVAAPDGESCGGPGQYCLSGNCISLNDRCECIGDTCTYYFGGPSYVSYCGCNSAKDAVLAGNAYLPCSGRCRELHNSNADVYWCGF